uniref:Sodium/hydrogen exchanger n=1 Tax=Lynceus sp. MCZ IZ 141354 TaxID=1930659 RepID=A0A9N6ZFG8_9CRUS|nr:EOG090X03SL [Lynceus sp. MCZ IZ 141354]
MNSSETSQESLLPEKGSAEQEHLSSLSIFLVLCLLGLCILLIHFLLKVQFHYIPESVIIIFLGAMVGLFLKLMSYQNIANWSKEEAFSPTIFFLVLLPPIIFESGYNLHKGNFFANFGSIVVFAIFGTLISAMVIGGGIYLLGIADVVYRLNLVESFAFGSLISAVDPVATLAIFQALDVDPVLNMLVFGESILNDAVSIVLTTTMLEVNSPIMASMNTGQRVLHAFGRFCLMFFASAAIGVAFALVSALLLKHVQLRRNPSLEFGMMLVFTYLPYVLAEGLHLSGIMAILFCGIVMSHYTHYNLSPITQITMQQTMRTMALAAETSVFAYLGLGIFSFPHRLEPALVIWAIFLCLLGRLFNIVPLANIVNRFRTHKITKKMMFIMWFSGLRGAIAYALSLHLEFETEKRRVIVTTTLIIVLFTILFLGGSTMPLLKCLKARTPGNRARSRTGVSLSKTLKMAHSEITEEESDVTIVDQVSGFAKFDARYLFPLFTRRFSQQEMKDGRAQLNNLTNQWYLGVRNVSQSSLLDEELNNNS